MKRIKAYYAKVHEDETVTLFRPALILTLKQAINEISCLRNAYVYYFFYGSIKEFLSPSFFVRYGNISFEEFEKDPVKNGVCLRYTSDGKVEFI